MFNRQVYMLKSATDLDSFIAINKIDRYIVLGTFSDSHRIPAIDAKIVETSRLHQVLVNAIKKQYQLIITAPHDQFLMSSPVMIKNAIDILERRYYMSTELFNL